MTLSAATARALAYAAGTQAPSRSNLLPCILATYLRSYAGSAAKQILVVGGGTAGLTVAAQLARQNRGPPRNIKLLEPSSVHQYQPAWTLVAGGIMKKEDTRRPQAPLIPRGVEWLQEAADKLDPDTNTVATTTGRQLRYDYLVLATGLSVNVDQVPGLREGLEGYDDVTTAYKYDYSDKLWRALQKFKGGKLLFTQPSTVIKCGGAPQKVMWLAEDYCRRQGIRKSTEVTFATATPAIFGVKKYSDILQRMAGERDVTTLLGHNLVEVVPTKREAVLQAVATGEHVRLSYDLLHVTPPMGPMPAVRDSPVSNQEGWVDVDMHTLQHSRYPNVFALGDCAALPTSKTAAAITSQSPVLVHNLLQHMRGGELTAKYDGYTSCPLLLKYGSLMLAEFKYGAVPKETFGWLWDQGRPTWAFYKMKTDVFPYCYWHYFVKGTWYGTRTFFPPKFTEPAPSSQQMETAQKSS